MEIIKAESMGMCFGVKDALSTIMSLSDSSDYTIYGELVHNQAIMNNLYNQGFQVLSESDRDEIPSTRHIIVTAHGLSNKRKEQLKKEGKTLTDTTCPLVRKIHQTALKYEQDGFTVILLGKKKHVEVQGIIEDLQTYFIVETENDIKHFSSKKLVILCQSTSSNSKVSGILKKIKEKNYDAEIQFINTICKPTLDRQEAVISLLEKVDALIAVGGRNSNNTLQLIKTAEDKNIPAFHVESVNDLDFRLLSKYKRIGLTAGSSTPDSIIDNVYHKLQHFAKKTLQVN